MYLPELLKTVGKKYRKIYVKGICFDSRKAKKNDIFFAIQGNKLSGTKFIKNAILKKVSAIVETWFVTGPPPNVHAGNPPFSTDTFVCPNSRNIHQTRAALPTPVASYAITWSSFEIPRVLM